MRCCLCNHKYPQYTLHRFPSERNHDLFLRWLEVLPEHIQQIDHSVLRKKYLICESHFSRDDYFPVQDERKRLKKNSTPKLEPVESCATPQMKRTDLPPNVQRNIDESPEIEIVSLGLDDIGFSSNGIDGNIDILGPPADNHAVLNDITDQSSNNIEVITVNTSKGKCTRTGLKRTMKSFGEFKKQRLDINYDSTLSPNQDDIPLPVQESCQNTESSDIQNEYIILPHTTTPFGIAVPNEFTLFSTTEDLAPNNAISPSRLNVQVPLLQTYNTTVQSECENSTVKSLDQTECISQNPVTAPSEGAKLATNQTEGVKKNKKSSIRTATVKPRNRGIRQRSRRYSRAKAMSYVSRRKTIDENVLNYTFSKLNLLTCDFLPMLLNNTNMAEKGRRFTLEDRAIAALWMKLGPWADNAIRRLRFNLPSRRTIMRILGGIVFPTGINERLMNSLKKIVESMFEDDKLCYITFDERHLHEGLHYDMKRDAIVGFQDTGCDPRPIFADQVMVVMVRGIRQSWKQPIAYYFTNAGMNRNDIIAMIKDVIRSLHDIGLKVLATVCDASTSNISAINYLLNETKADYLRKNEENRNFGFVIDDCEIIPLYDPPHLLEAFQNKFFKRNLKFCIDGTWYVASWADILEFYEYDRADPVTRLCSTLTINHIDPSKGGKMKMKNAAQIFSQRLSACMRAALKYNVFTNCQRAKGTIELLWFFDQLFDSVNGFKMEVEQNKFLFCTVAANSQHHRFWDRAIKILGSMEFIVTDGGQKKPPSLVKWIDTLKGFEHLWQVLQKNYNFTFMVPRNINQDSLENFFSGVSLYGFPNTNLTAYQFTISLKAILVNSCALSKYFDVDKSSWTSAMRRIQSLVYGIDDGMFEGTLMNYQCLNNDVNLESDDGTFDVDDVIMNHDENERKTEIIQKELRESTRYYLAGFLANRVYKCVNYCSTCKNDIISKKGNKKFVELVLGKRRGNFCEFKFPDHRFFNLFSDMYDIAKRVVPLICHQPEVRSLLSSIIGRIEKRFVFSCTKHKVFDILLNLFTSFYIRVWILNINSILSGKDICQVDDKIKQLALKVLNQRKSYVKKFAQMKNQNK